METVIAALKADINTLKESLENEMKASRLLTEEREKLKVRIIRLVAKKGNF
jgi:regulator of replication initiation timing